ncbi:hypothetical protein BWQ96_07914 [Gracilariopsis chorda]|uniref:Uncharacterized protein n=1 Tax=Gracilariopsis chorda TaxID=448386 RepID=A0A2V3IJW8_9FLOR|nr:hypothetical protein BWQ96_07914 [Gracilariopsis chorda]|eukprot:PXF42394.1 hypothetical protein BWQ96_07914 [Gracilariopsis chorda]
MTLLRLAISIVILFGLIIRCKCEDVSRIITKTKSSETIQIKNKLATAEGKVSDLISRLDSVSDDATRAKNEIHSTLIEVWKIVDMLGQDRCGDVVDKVRAAQQKAQSKIVELQEEIRGHLKETESLKLKLVQQEEATANLNTEIKAERSRREALEIETRELRDKLHWANAVSNETQKYELVAERLQNLLVVVSERTQLLRRIETMVGDAHSGFSNWKEEIESLTNIVRDAERDFAGGYKSAAISGLKRQSEDLERRLRDAQKGKDSLADERNSLRKSLELLQTKLNSGMSTSKKNIEYVYKPPQSTEEGQSWVGTLTLCILSVCTGAVLVFLLSNWQQNKEMESPAQEKYGFTPSSSATTPGFQRTSASPLQFVNSGNSKTPTSRGSTPRRY